MGLFFLIRIIGWAFRLASSVYLMTHPAVPLRLKLLPVLAVAYCLWPRDLWPDYLPFGFVDDIIIGVILLSIFTSKAWPYVLGAGKEKNSDRVGGQEGHDNGQRRRRQQQGEVVSVDFKVVDDDRRDSQGREREERRQDDERN